MVSKANRFISSSNQREEMDPNRYIYSIIDIFFLFCSSLQLIVVESKNCNSSTASSRRSLTPSRFFGVLSKVVLFLRTMRTRYVLYLLVLYIWWSRRYCWSEAIRNGLKALAHLDHSWIQYYCNTAILGKSTLIAAIFADERYQSWV